MGPEVTIAAPPVLWPEADVVLLSLPVALLPLLEPVLEPVLEAPVLDEPPLEVEVTVPAPLEPLLRLTAAAEAREL